jgi:hypothetical protein
MGKTPSARRKELAKTLDLHPTMVTFLKAIKPCFDPAAIEKVRQAAQGIFPSTSNVLGQSNPVVQLEASQQMPYTLSFNSAQALAGLNGKVTDLPGSVNSALDVIFTHRLITKQIKSLVKWMVSGKPAAEFDPRKKVKKSKVKPLVEDDKGETDTDSQSGISPHSEAQQASLSKIDLKKAAELLKKAEAEKVLGKETTELKKLLAYFQTIIESTQSKILSSKKGIHDNSNLIETVYLSWLADAPLIKKIKSKVGKGQPITSGEKCLLWLHKFGEWTGWMAKHLFKLLKPFKKLFHLIWKLLVESLEVLGILKYIKAVLVIAAFVFFGWFAWEAWRYGFMHPVRILEPYCFRKTEETPIQESPTPVPVASEPKSKPKATFVSKSSKSAAVYQPSIAWQSSAEDQKVLDTEIAAVPVNCIVKDFPLTPDEGMSGDLAVSRLQNLTDPDKYTMKIGNGTQKILSVNATTTNLIINYQSTDALGGLNGSIQMNRFWEDVMMIHVNEIEVQGKNPKVIYQCSLIVSGAKEPLTIQCSTPEDLKHLVSTMEYFIRASRLAHDTALAGMPYPSQGMRLNNQCLVEALWANSPMDKAGVKLGDMIWSLEKDAPLQPERKNLEAALQTLTPGSHALYIVSPANRDKGLVQMNANHTNVFNPKRLKVVLRVF